MDVLREHLMDECGLALNDVMQVHNKMVEGKYPERQAYNKDGLLVTFPTPQHKQRAISRGTHFEKDPSLGKGQMFGGKPQLPQEPQANVFGAPKQGAPPTKAPAPAPAAPTQVPQGQSAPSALPASTAPPPDDSAAAALGAKQTPTALPPSDQQAAASAQQPLAVEPPAPADPNTPMAAAPPPNFEQPKSPQVRAAEAQAVKQIFKGDDTNPTLLPSMTEAKLVELHRVFNFARQMGYNEAAKVLSEAMNIKR